MSKKQAVIQKELAENEEKLRIAKQQQIPLQTQVGAAAKINEDYKRKTGNSIT